jgi:hypothetical protein
VKASEFIDRLKDLIDVVGDVDIIIEQAAYHYDSGYYELAACETQRVRKETRGDILYTDNFITPQDEVLNLIKVY